MTSPLNAEDPIEFTKTPWAALPEPTILNWLATELPARSIVAPSSMVTVAVPKAELEPARRTPEETCKPPVNELSPLRRCCPAPTLRRPPGPLTGPESTLSARPPAVTIAFNSKEPAPERDPTVSVTWKTATAPAATATSVASDSWALSRSLPPSTRMAPEKVESVESSLRVPAPILVRENAPLMPPVKVSVSLAPETEMVLSAVSRTCPARLLLRSANVPPAKVTRSPPTATP